MASEDSKKVKTRQRIVFSPQRESNVYVIRWVIEALPPQGRVRVRAHSLLPYQESSPSLCRGATRCFYFSCCFFLCTSGLKTTYAGSSKARKLSFIPSPPLRDVTSKTFFVIASMCLPSWCFIVESTWSCNEAVFLI